ncbi:CPBP family intramembrane glutamic endopeptidase, partial [Dactylosporangium sp. NPDC048998]|uniref:CPBP family intramembrane glutamic endopeptidase n=1 Tax=Dactylosporangium sp. NPDC048998 TaxID=3363976 RepID=UPI00371D6A61
LDRLWGVGTALTAGICEEIVFRGLLYGAAITLLGLDPWFAALISATLFGLAHRYQGPAGVIGTGLLGLALTALYATSGSLLLPIALHVALDIAAFVLPTTIVEPTPDPAPPAAPQPPIDRAAPGIRLRSAAPDSTTPA